MADTYNKKAGAASLTGNAPGSDKNPAEGATPETDPSERENSADGAIKYFFIGEAASAFGVKFLNEEACRDWVIETLHPWGESCVNCGKELDGTSAIRFLSGNRCQCRACGHWFTARSGTFLQGSQLTYAQVFLLAALIDIMEKGLTPDRIAGLVGVTGDTVRNWIRKFKVLGGNSGR